MGDRETVARILLLVVVLGILWLVRPVVHHAEERVLVERVVDGDTLDLADGRRVRLLGINAPDKGEPGYEEARGLVKRLVEEKTVILVHEGERDRYGRLLGWVHLENGTCLNVLLVEKGLARPYLEDVEGEKKEAILRAWEKAIENRAGILGKESEHPCAGCIVIESVVYDPPGDDCENPEQEVVILGNRCNHSCNIAGWVLGDESTTHRYRFGNITVPPGERVRVHSGCGTDNETDLYWCPEEDCKAVWNNNGDTVWLWDSEGRIVLVKHL